MVVGSFFFFSPSKKEQEEGVCIWYVTTDMNRTHALRCTLIGALNQSQICYFNRSHTLHDGAASPALACASSLPLVHVPVGTACCVNSELVVQPAQHRTAVSPRRIVIERIPTRAESKCAVRKPERLFGFSREVNNTCKPTDCAALSFDRRTP